MNAHTDLASLRQKDPDRIANPPATFNPDAWHAMQQRDDQLIRDSILHGYAGKEYVYKFKISGQEVTGVSVVGARELASHYGGIKHRIVASVDKTGSLFVFKSFEPLNVQANIIPQLADEDDFYEVVIEITDIKTGNSAQVRKKETKNERRQNGSKYSRPHYDVIAESKAYRNGVLSIIPQSVIKEFESRALRAGNSGDEKTIDQLREGAVVFGAKNGVSIDRQALSSLTYAEIYGLGAAAAVGIKEFRESAEALGIVRSAPATTAEGMTPKLEEKQPVTVPQSTSRRQVAPEFDLRPDPEEEAAIRAREMSDASEQQQPAPNRTRRERGGMAIE
jgi:hypothetical protein